MITYGAEDDGRARPPVRWRWQHLRWPRRRTRQRQSRGLLESKRTTRVGRGHANQPERARKCSSRYPGARRHNNRNPGSELVSIVRHRQVVIIESELVSIVRLSAAHLVRCHIRRSVTYFSAAASTRERQGTALDLNWLRSFDLAVTSNLA